MTVAAPRAPSLLYRAMKRAVDLAVALVGLTLGGPVILLVALLVRLRIGRPVFFRQRRPGQHGRIFEILKFRTMTEERDERGELLPDEVRLTRFGAFMRRASLDELPQLVNLLRGDLSLVGPRPLLVEYLEHYSEREMRRHEVKPGITGWAQVNGRNALTWEQKFEYDVWYVENASFSLDLRILWLTAFKVLAGSDVTPRDAAMMPRFRRPRPPAEGPYTRPMQGVRRRPSRLYLSPPHMSGREVTLVQEAFESNWIAPLGPHVDAFEQEFGRAVDVPHAAALSSGTAAIHLALQVLGVGPGQDVLCSSLTFVASANPIVYVGARPVFVDSEPHSWNLDPALVVQELEDRAREGRLPAAVVLVHLYGQPADLNPILAACERHRVPLIEDAAEALGSRYAGRPAGSFGVLGIFSFNGNKIITTSGGGMLVSSNAGYVERARFLATQARDPAPHYEHSTIGNNYRMSNVLAAIGRGQLQALPERVAARRNNFQAYREGLGDVPGISFPGEPHGFSNRWLTTILVDSREFGATREDLRLALEERNIEARPVWKPLHMQPVFADCRRLGGTVAERLFRDGLCLPSGSQMTPDDLAEVIDAVRGVHRLA